MAEQCFGGCGRDPRLDWDDPDARYCRACWAEVQAWRFAEWVDSQAKKNLTPD